MRCCAHTPPHAPCPPPLRRALARWLPPGGLVVRWVWRRRAPHPHLCCGLQHNGVRHPRRRQGGCACAAPRSPCPCTCSTPLAGPAHPCTLLVPPPPPTLAPSPSPPPLWVRGGTDVSDALQSLLDDAGKLAARRSVGVTVLVPRGTYRLDKPVTISHANVTLRGEGVSARGCCRGGAGGRECGAGARQRTRAAQPQLNQLRACSPRACSPPRRCSPSQRASPTSTAHSSTPFRVRRGEGRARHCAVARHARPARPRPPPLDRFPRCRQAKVGVGLWRRLLLHPGRPR